MAGRSATAREDIASLRTIGDVADALGLPQHVLRFWETRFKEIDPVKRAGGRRYYRPRDIELVEAIRHLLYREGYTIKGVQRILKEQGVEAVIAEVRRRQNGESPAAAPAPTAETAPRPPDPAAQIVLDLPDPEPRISVTPDPDAALSPPASPPVPAATPVFHAPMVIARPADTPQAEALREVLAEIAECRRLLKVTRR
ncbi:MerR family transcriptional regulator [Methylocystis echinoides]|uniref:MerR family transcriptional regulator n=1 Tax=Methylocystis echinoides TaxID=29468 RepID=A0A9W6GU43_9HYPH|nr:MerR family transcriptional regulator [Methylocystis echinoides]GLI93071.1 MerR family transcriptional regulator [Methylocystis echinoides]